jgi:hypothetical protein
VDTVPIGADTRPDDEGEGRSKDIARVPNPTAPLPKGPRGRMPRTLVAALVVAVLVISGAVALNITTGALERLNPFRNGLVQNRTVDRSGSGYYQLVVDVEKDVRPVPSFLAGQRVLFIASGTVEVGVDLRHLDNGAIQVNKDRTSATITLPEPALSAPNLDLAHSYVYSQQRGLFDRIKDAVGNNATDEQQLYTLAEQKLAQAAAQSDDLKLRGETNTRSMLEGLLRSLGFTSVTIRFAAQDG